MNTPPKGFTAQQLKAAQMRYQYGILKPWNAQVNLTPLIKTGAMQNSFYNWMSACAALNQGTEFTENLITLEDTVGQEAFAAPADSRSAFIDPNGFADMPSLCGFTLKYNPSEDGTIPDHEILVRVFQGQDFQDNGTWPDEASFNAAEVTAWERRIQVQAYTGGNQGLVLLIPMIAADSVISYGTGNVITSSVTGTAVSGSPLPLDSKGLIVAGTNLAGTTVSTTLTPIWSGPRFVQRLYNHVQRMSPPDFLKVQVAA